MASKNGPNCPDCGKELQGTEKVFGRCLRDFYKLQYQPPRTVKAVRYGFQRRKT